MLPTGIRVDVVTSEVVVEYLGHHLVPVLVPVPFGLPLKSFSILAVAFRESIRQVDEIDVIFEASIFSTTFPRMLLRRRGGTGAARRNSPRV